MLTVVGWLWRDVEAKHGYQPGHVDTWARMIHRHLRSTPHRFVVMTDTPGERFSELVTPVELWPDWRELRREIHWPLGRPNCYTRLKAFSEEARALFGDRFVSIDLDCIVMDDLDPLFDRPEDFLICHRPQTRGRPVHNLYQGSMWYMLTGARPEVWLDFKGEESIRAAAAYLGTDQAWINYRLGLGEAGWTWQDGVAAWPEIVADNRWLYAPPPGLRIIFFHGDQKPWHFCSINDSRTRARNPGQSHLWVERFYQ